MTTVSCYGVEYFDEEGIECPFQECIARQDCKSIYQSSRGVLHDRRVRIQSENITKKKIKKEKKKEKKEKIQNKILRIKKGIERSVGYTKPKRLEYKNEGCLRDEMMDHIIEFLKDTKYSIKTTRYLQSVSDNFIGPHKTKYLLKISTTRKKSILVYIDNELSDLVDTKSFVCRQVFEHERLCFPDYLEWVVVVDSIPKLEKFLTYLEV